jgi:hypothetical protein
MRRPFEATRCRVAWQLYSQAMQNLLSLWLAVHTHYTVLETGPLTPRALQRSDCIRVSRGSTLVRFQFHNAASYGCTAVQLTAASGLSLSGVILVADVFYSMQHTFQASVLTMEPM